MAIDRDAMREQLAKAKAARNQGFAQRLKDGTTNLRVLEFVDDTGNPQFARTVSQFRFASDTKKTILDRQRTFGASCAATKLHEGNESPFQRRQTTYYVNAINIDKTPHKMEIFSLPTSVWEAIAEMLVGEEWSDVLEPTSGHAFAITRSGKELETEYSVVVGRKPWPVSEELQGQIKDPYSAVKDPGLVGQCEAMSLTVEDVFPDGIDELEMVEPIVTGEPTAEAPAAKPAKAAAKPVAAKSAAKAPAPKPAPAAKPVAAKPKPTAKPKAAEPEIGVGTRITTPIEDTQQPGVVMGIEGDMATVELDFDTENQYDVALSELALEEAAVEEQAGDEELPVPKKPVASGTAKAAATKLAGVRK